MTDQPKKRGGPGRNQGRKPLATDGHNWRTTMKVKAIRIESGVITGEFYARTKTIKEFFAGKKPAIEIFPVKGWKFSRVYLTHGNQENGEGWAFIK